MAFGNGLDLMLAVTVKGSPLNCRLALGTPVKVDFPAVVLDDQIAALEGAW